MEKREAELLEFSSPFGEIDRAAGREPPPLHPPASLVALLILAKQKVTLINT